MTWCRKVHTAGHPLNAERREGVRPGKVLLALHRPGTILSYTGPSAFEIFLHLASELHTGVILMTKYTHYCRCT